MDTVCLKPNTSQVADFESGSFQLGAQRLNIKVSTSESEHQTSLGYSWNFGEHAECEVLNSRLSEM